MITHLGTACIYVKDQQKALEFYRDVLGFEVRRDQPMGPEGRWIEVAPKGAQTRLVTFTPKGHEDRIGTFSGLVFSCKDIDETYKTLTAKGVEFKEKPEKQPWGGILAQFYDVDKNTHVLVQE
jgi:predicted enzyme related to lactoylglutathione lyase